MPPLLPTSDMILRPPLPGCPNPQAQLGSRQREILDARQLALDATSSLQASLGRLQQRVDLAEEAGLSAAEVKVSGATGGLQ